MSSRTPSTSTQPLQLPSWVSRVYRIVSRTPARCSNTGSSNGCEEAVIVRSARRPCSGASTVIRCDTSGSIISTEIGPTVVHFILSVCARALAWTFTCSFPRITENEASIT
jgi:hypothetical protein